MQGAQMPANAIRGIGRWSTEFVLALLRYHPELVAGISVDPVLPLPGLVSVLPSHVPLLRSDEAPPGWRDGGVVFHALSPLEDMSLDALWPFWARDPMVGLTTTLYDMIPLLFPTDYFAGALKRLLQVRYELHRQADSVIGISRTTVDDAVSLLGLERDRTFVASGGVNGRFRPHELGREGAKQELAASGLQPDFVLTIGNVDPRKNLRSLVTAYSLLPAELRKIHQLVITCSQGDTSYLQDLIDYAASVGVRQDVVVYPYVSDELMVLFYQACELMVYPSLYEGLGLPLIEAMASGAAVLASDVGPMREIVVDEHARFDPSSVVAISEALNRMLSDRTTTCRLRKAATREAAAHTWKQSISSAVSAYDVAVRP